MWEQGRAGVERWSRRPPIAKGDVGKAIAVPAVIRSTGGRYLRSFVPKLERFYPSRGARRGQRYRSSTCAQLAWSARRARSRRNKKWHAGRAGLGAACCQRRAVIAAATDRRPGLSPWCENICRRDVRAARKSLAGPRAGLAPRASCHASSIRGLAISAVGGRRHGRPHVRVADWPDDVPRGRRALVAVPLSGQARKRQRRLQKTEASVMFA